ncbi:hypothetical protein D3C80_1785770 [compost metagenome]
MTVDTGDELVVALLGVTVVVVVVVGVVVVVASLLSCCCCCCSSSVVMRILFRSLSISCSSASFCDCGFCCC